MLRNILFIDATWTVLSRYPLELANKLSDKYDECNMHFINMGTAGDDINTIKHAKEKLTSRKNYFRYDYKYYDLSKISLYLQEIKPQMIFLGGYRLFDLIVCYYSKMYNIKVYSVQHGFDVDHFNRSSLAMIFKLRKIIRYYYGLFILSKIARINFPRLLWEYSQYIKSGKPLQGSVIDLNTTKPDCFFVYSKYYIIFFNKKFGVPENIIKVMGSIDLYKILIKSHHKKKKAICYLAQTFVEDGRMTTNEFIKTQENYKKIYQELKSNIYIKLHPRSNEKLYQIFKDLKNVFLVRQEFPICEIYLGHYSSTVFNVKAINSYLILHEINKEKIPNVFSECADLITNKISDVKSTFCDWESNIKLPIKQPTDFINSAIPTIHPFDCVINNIETNFN